MEDDNGEWNLEIDRSMEPARGWVFPPGRIKIEIDQMEWPAGGVFTRPGESQSLTMSEYEERQRRRRRWKLLLLLLVVVILVVVVLALTVFKSKDPRVAINGIDLETLSITDSSSFFSLSLSLLLDVTVHNPNRGASFRYSEGVTRLVYYGAPVGQALIPAGHIPSRGEEYLSVLLFLESSSAPGGVLVFNEHLAGNIVSGRLPVVATTTLSGTVTAAFGLFRHHAVSVSDCEISVFLANATLESFFCRHAAAVKLA